MQLLSSEFVYTCQLELCCSPYVAATRQEIKRFHFPDEPTKTRRMADEVSMEEKLAQSEDLERLCQAVSPNEIRPDVA